jgi:hypothetical protein
VSIVTLDDLDKEIFDLLVTTDAPAQGGRDTREVNRGDCTADYSVPVHWLYREFRNDPVIELPYITFFRRALAQVAVPVNRVTPILEVVDATTVRRRIAPDWFNLDYQISFGSRNWTEFNNLLWDLRGKVFPMADGATRYLTIDGIDRQVLLTAMVDRHSRSDQIYRNDLVFSLLLPLYPVQNVLDPGGPDDLETITTLEGTITYFVSQNAAEEVETFSDTYP